MLVGALHTYCSLGVSGKECYTPRLLRVTRAEVEEGALHSVPRLFLQQDTELEQLQSGAKIALLRINTLAPKTAKLHATATKAKRPREQCPLTPPPRRRSLAPPRATHERETKTQKL